MATTTRARSRSDRKPADRSTRSRPAAGERTGASRALAERIVGALGARGRGLEVLEPGGSTARYVRVAEGGKTVAYVQARSRSPHEIALTRGDPEAIARALPEGRDAYTRRFTGVRGAQGALRAALAEGAPGRRRQYVA